MRALIAYGSKRGGTEGLARALGSELRALGVPVDVRMASEVDDLDGYDAVIVGGALYSGRWHKDARRLVARQARSLRARLTWFFSSGPLDDSATRQAIPPVPGVKRLMDLVGARGHVTFGGRLEPNAQGFLVRQMARTHAGDWRDPAQVRAWARRLTGALVAASLAAPEPPVATGATA